MTGECHATSARGPTASTTQPTTRPPATTKHAVPRFAASSCPPRCMYRYPMRAPSAPCFFPTNNASHPTTSIPIHHPQALPQPGSSPVGSSPSALRTPPSPLPAPDYAISLYLPGVASTTVNDAMIQFNATYDKLEKEKQQQQLQQQQEMHKHQQGQQSRKGGGSDGADGGSPFARLAVRPGLWSWGSQALLYSPGMRASLLTHYREAMAGCRANDGFQVGVRIVVVVSGGGGGGDGGFSGSAVSYVQFVTVPVTNLCVRQFRVSTPTRTSPWMASLQSAASPHTVLILQHAHLDHPLLSPRAPAPRQDIILDRHAIARGCAGAPSLGPLTTPPARSGAACDPRVIHAAWVQRLQRIHHPNANTNTQTNTTSSNSRTGAGTRPESTSANDNPATEATYAGSAAGPATADAGIDMAAAMGSGTGLEHWSTSCYLLASHPSLVQHVGASSALFGASSSRFHVALDFPTRVAVPGFDAPDGWRRRRRQLQRRQRR